MYRAALISPAPRETLLFVAAGGELVDFFRKDEAFVYTTETAALEAAANAVKSLGGIPDPLRNYTALPEAQW